MHSEAGGPRNSHSRLNAPHAQRVPRTLLGANGYVVRTVHAPALLRASTIRSGASPWKSTDTSIKPSNFAPPSGAGADLTSGPDGRVPAVFAPPTG